MTASKSSDEMIPQADQRAHTKIAERAGRGGKQPSTVDDTHKMSSDEAIPQADKQAHTEIAERAGRDEDKQP
jgi:hypothetical protein